MTPTPARSSRSKFSLGRLVATPDAFMALLDADMSPTHLLRRHVRGDWGEVCEDDRRSNERALEVGARLLSVYILPTTVRVWVITEADRSATTILLPHQY